MLAIEKEIIREMTNDIEIAAYHEDFIDDVDSILEDFIMGLDDDDTDI